MVYTGLGLALASIFHNGLRKDRWLVDRQYALKVMKLPYA